MKNPINSLHLIFRIACAMCFIGHGAFGFITKAVWCNYFAVFGIGQSMAYQLMPLVGFMDVLMGIVLLVHPLRISAVWLVFWGLFTASLRPLSGEPFAEFLERAGNYGAPVILLLLSVPPPDKGPGWFFRLIPASEITEERQQTIRRCLQFFGFLLLAGHGWLNLIEKQGLLNQYIALGFENPSAVAKLIGAVECTGAFIIMVWPARTIILMLLIWKVTSEMWYPAYSILEWVERGGSYAILLGLWIVLRHYNISSQGTGHFLPGLNLSKRDLL